MDIINLISYLSSAKFQNSLLSFKIAILVLSLFSLFLIIYFLFKTNYLKLLILQDLFEFLTYRPYGLRRIEKEWIKIIERLETGSEAEYKLAVIEADSMLDDILKKMGYGGENLKDRLKYLTQATIPNLDSLLEAHKIRNNIIHDPDYRFSLEDGKKILAIYEKTFQDIQAL